jgi:poly(A) polymerase
MTRLDLQPWMTALQTAKLMAALGEARFVGGAVRNALLGKPVSDVDVATPLVPADIVTRLVAAGIKAVPTGIEHGTITAVVDGKPYEVTTLRRDVETDGRRAVVAFTTDWAEDARRRDFTMNALYASADGEVLDTVGGVTDLKAGRVRFVGDPVTRIREDYLRILRLFRFHAWYGKGDIDPDALRAAAQEKAGIAKLSGERIAKEMLRLLEAEAPVAVVRAMAQKSVLSEVLPGEPNLLRLDNLVAIDASNFFTPDPLLRLASLLPGMQSAVPPVEFAEAIAGRWKLSTAQRKRLEDLGSSAAWLSPDMSARDVRRQVYRIGKARFRDHLLLRWAEEPKAAVQWSALLAIAHAWDVPRFPLSGTDAIRAGIPEGPEVGRMLAQLEACWIEGDFAADAAMLAQWLKETRSGVILDP